MNPQVPLQLESYFLESLNCHVRAEFDKKQVPLEQVDVKSDSFEHKETSNRFMVRLRVKVGQKDGSNARCELDMVVVGFFRLPGGLDQGMRITMHAQNAPSILYGVARQIVAETTGNGPWGRVFLPTMNFVAASGGRVAAQPQAEPEATAVADRPPSKKRS